MTHLSLGWYLSPHFVSIGKRIPSEAPIMIVGKELPRGLLSLSDFEVQGSDDFCILALA